MTVFVSFLGDFKLCLGFCRVVVLNVVFAKGKSLRFYFNYDRFYELTDGTGFVLCIKDKTVLLSNVVKENSIILLG